MTIPNAETTRSQEGQYQNRRSRSWGWRGVILAAAAVPVIGAGVAFASVAGHPQDTTIHGCVNNRTKVLTVARAGRRCPAWTTPISWNQTGPQGPRGLPGPAAPAGGLPGPEGARGTAGADGTNVLTSDSAPTGNCTSGDTNIDLSTGEVYSCVSGAWTDAGYSIKWSAGSAVTTVVTQVTNGSTATATCPGGDTALGGGASGNGAATPALVSSYPLNGSGGKLQTGQQPVSWKIIYASAVGPSYQADAYVICSP